MQKKNRPSPEAEAVFHQNTGCKSGEIIIGFRHAAGLRRQGVSHSRRLRPGWFVRWCFRNHRQQRCLLFVRLYCHNQRRCWLFRRCCRNRLHWRCWPSAREWQMHNPHRLSFRLPWQQFRNKLPVLWFLLPQAHWRSESVRFLQKERNRIYLLTMFFS